MARDEALARCPPAAALAAPAALGVDGDRVASVFGACDRSVEGWRDEPGSAMLVKPAVRALVLHSQPPMALAFGTSYAPLQPHMPCEGLLLG